MIKFITTQSTISDIFVRSSVDEMIVELETMDTVSLDTETEGFDPYTCSILSLQLGNEKVQYVIDFQTLTKIEVYKIKIFLESGKLILMHNALFDLRFLYKHDIDVKNIYDTFLAELILTTGYEHKNKLHPFYTSVSLQNVAHKYCGVALNKSIRSQITYLGLTSEVIKYGAEDVEHLSKIRDLQMKFILKHDLKEVLDLENTVVRVFAKMIHSGITLDVTKWLKVADITESNTHKLVKELDALVFTDDKLNKYIPDAYTQNLFGFEERKLNVNWASPAQKLEILHTLGLDVESVDEKTLLRNKNKHAIVSKLIDFSKQSKLANSFGRKFVENVNEVTGKVHMSIWQILSTGRIATSTPNLNQIPSKGELGPLIRSAFIPTTGYKIVGGDYSSFELAIIAEFSKDPIWLDALSTGKNLHSELCAATFDIPLEDVNKPFPQKPDLTYRALQKTIDFGWLKILY